MYMKKVKILIAVGVLILGIAACSKEGTDNAPSMEGVSLSKEKAMNEFARILSRATYSSCNLREFLKSEACKHFDKNDDVLYEMVKDRAVGSETFRDVLLSFTSRDTLSAIEQAIPLLNVLVPTIAIFDITPSNLDVTDAEIPVAIRQEKGMDLYINGYIEATIPNGELPAFHSFVVNENSRVNITKGTRGGESIISFISPNYDGSALVVTKSEEYDAAQVGAKAVQAYNYFNRDDGSNYSKALQRDYIYYGMTPNDTTGRLNRAVSEYLRFMEVNPNSYNVISDQMTEDGEIFEDPRIVNEEVSKKKHDFTPEELINAMWFKGSYNFRFCVFYSNKDHPVDIYIPMRPEELWNFNYDKTFRNKTWFRKRKYTYKIDPSKFTAKRVELDSLNLSIGGWDLSSGSLEKYITISEVDKSATYTVTSSFETNKLNSSKINGDIKFGLGIGNGTTIGVGVGADGSSSSTKKETKTYSYTRQEADDIMGTAQVNFYDPIIDTYADGKYIVHSYNTGTIKFGITVR